MKLTALPNGIEEGKYEQTIERARQGAPQALGRLYGLMRDRGVESIPIGSSLEWKEEEVFTALSNAMRDHVIALAKEAVNSAEALMICAIFLEIGKLLVGFPEHVEAVLQQVPMYAVIPLAREYQESRENGDFEQGVEYLVEIKNLIGHRPDFEREFARHVLPDYASMIDRR